MSYSRITLAVSLQWVQMQPTSRLQGRVLGVSGISGVKRQRSPRHCLVRRLDPGRAIHFVLPQPKRLRTLLMQLILPLRLGLVQLDPLQE